jgi:hypothetical protein
MNNLRELLSQHVANANVAALVELYDTLLAQQKRTEFELRCAEHRIKILSETLHRLTSGPGYGKRPRAKLGEEPTAAEQARDLRRGATLAETVSAQEIEI